MSVVTNDNAKNKTQAVLKSSLKTSTDNLCGPSEEGLKNKEV